MSLSNGPGGVSPCCPQRSWLLAGWGLGDIGMEEQQGNLPTEMCLLLPQLCSHHPGSGRGGTCPAPHCWGSQLEQLPPPPPQASQGLPAAAEPLHSPWGTSTSTGAALVLFMVHISLPRFYSPCPR